MTCVPRENSDQPGRLPSLIRIFAVHFMGSKGSKASSGRQRTLIRSESSLGALATCLVLSCSGSILAGNIFLHSVKGKTFTCGKQQFDKLKGDYISDNRFKNVLCYAIVLDTSNLKHSGS